MDWVACGNGMQKKNELCPMLLLKQEEKKKVAVQCVEYAGSCGENAVHGRTKGKHLPVRHTVMEQE